MNKFNQLIRSRKFWGAVVALGVAVAGNRAGLSEDAITNAVVVCVSYIIGTGLEDARLKG